MRLFCQCTAPMACVEADEVERASQPSLRLTFVCPDCRHEVAMSCTVEETEAVLDRMVWTNQARHRLDRIPPFAWPAVQEETEAYAKAMGRRLMTAGLVDEAQHKGMLNWTAEAERRLQNVPEPVRAMARVEIERMARERGEQTVTAALMDEAKGKFLGFRGPR